MTDGDDVTRGRTTRRPLLKLAAGGTALTSATMPPADPVSLSEVRPSRVAALTFKDGRAVARFGGHHALPAGRYAVRAAYAGDATFGAARQKTSVDIG